MSTKSSQVSNPNENRSTLNKLILTDEHLTDINNITNKTDEFVNSQNILFTENEHFLDENTDRVTSSQIQQNNSDISINSDKNVDENNLDLLIEDGATSSLDNRRSKPALRLPLNVIVTDTDAPLNDGQKIINKTKKFYDSDDPFITTIFSQTITSTTVTPTDEEHSYTYDSPDQENHIERELIESDEKTGVGDWMTVEEAVAENSNNESQTENLDNYNETLISFMDTVILDQLYENTTDNAVSLIDHDPNQDFQYENVKNNHTDDENDSEHIYENIYVNNKQRPSIIVDCYNESEDNRSGPYYVEPITPERNVTSYFDQTIEDEFYDDVPEQHEIVGRENNDVNDQSLYEIENAVQKSSQIRSFSSDESENGSVTDGIDNNHCVGVHSAVERLESESTTVITTHTTTTSTKKSEKATKKKSESTGKKKSKKSKKSDPEKENISVHITVSTDEIKQKNRKSPVICHRNSVTHSSLVTNSPFIVNSAQNGSGGDQCNQSIQLLNTKKTINGKVSLQTRGVSGDVENSVQNFKDIVITSGVAFYEDDLSNIDVKSLKKIYLMEQSPQHPKEKYKEKERRVIINKDVSVKHLKSSFSKFDALQKKNILHVRSSDAGKAQEKFNGGTVEPEKNCRACNKAVYKMEEIKAERNIWHKHCFKCSDCSKLLNVDTYQSHESVLYCKPHFKALFTPKAVEDNNPVAPRKPELIIRENQPIELPPDVVRSCDKADLGLDELHQMNVKLRYQVFENNTTNDQESLPDRSPGVVKRSASILSKLAKFQAKGMDVGITDDSLNGITLEESSSDNDDNLDDETSEDIDLIRAKRAQRERPLSFANMNDIKSRFESGLAVTKEERREERKQEIQNIRSRLFMGKQAKIKEMYQQAVLDSEQGIRAVDKKPDMDIGDKARCIKDRFEKGEMYNNDEIDGTNNYHKSQDDDMAVFEQGIGKKSRSLFMEMDANAAKAPALTSAPVTPTPRTPDVKKNIQVSPVWPPQKRKPFEDVVKYDEKIDDIKIETADITNKFKFFETYKPSATEKKTFRITPPRDGVVKLPSPDRTDIYIDPDVIRSGEFIEDPIIAEKSHTTTKMLSMFRQMEEKNNETQQFDVNGIGLKPLKRFTPPPDEGRRLHDDSDSENDYTDSEDEDDDEEEEESEIDDRPPNQDYVRSSDKNVDEFLSQAQTAARAKQLRAKFERWESKEVMKEQNNSSVNLYDGSDQSQVETAKEIRAKFESMRDIPSHAEHRDRIKVNRFV